VLSKDKDDDSNERDPFTIARSISTTWAWTTAVGRDIRHKVNFFTYGRAAAAVPGERSHAGADGTAITTSPRVLNGDDRGRNWDVRGNKFFSPRLAPASVRSGSGRAPR